MARIMSIEVSGNFNNTDRFLDFIKRRDIFRALDRYGREGVDALSMATPLDTGMAASSWSYEIERTRTSWAIAWTNSDTVDGFSVVIGLQYGHLTGTGGWVKGRDFINPAARPIMDRIAEDVWKEVTSA